MEVCKHEGLGWGMDVKNKEKCILVGGIWGLGSNLVPGKLPGMHKDGPS